MANIVLAFVWSHSAIVSGAAIAVLDLLFALQPNWKSAGVLHWLYLALVSLKKVPPPAA